MATWRPHVTEQSPRLFDNDILELLSRTHPAIVVIIYGPLAAGLIWYGMAKASLSSGATVGLVILGSIAWTLTEYWLHRSLMHWIPDHDWGPRMHFWVHGVHHDWPNDPYRLVMPPAVSITLFFAFLGIFYLILGRNVWVFHGGFTLGYMFYDMAHYYYHHSRPQWSLAKSLQRHHLLHHFNKRYDERHFAITVPMWDRLFGTNEPTRDKG